MDDVIGVYGDWFNGFAIKSDHSLWSIPGDQPPVKIMDDVQEAANTYTNWIVLKTNGTVWVGPLYGNTPKPKQILSLSGVRQISAGIDSFYALKEDGTLWGWGNNYSGELGVKTKSPDVFVPVQIMKDVQSVYGTGQQGYAIKKDGTLWGWGKSDDLLLTGKKETWAFDPYSDGSQSEVSEQFTPIKLMDNVLKIDGRNHLTVIKKDHTLWDWGSNQEGQLGDGTVISRYVPQKILDHVVDVTAKGAFTIALKSDGTVVGFGINAVGELGIGTFDDDPHSTPIELMNNIAISGEDASFSAGVGAEPIKGPAAANEADAGKLADLEQIEPIKLPKPPFYYYLISSINPSAEVNKVNKLTLRQSSVKSIPIVREDSKAFQASSYVVPNQYQNIKGNLPAGIPTEYKGQMLVQAIKGANNVILIYGLNFGENRYLVVLNKPMTKIEKIYDFDNYAISPKYVQKDFDYIHQQIRWAVVENGILYISHSHRTYAKSSNGANGFISAIRINDNKLLWRTSSLVSNARNFQILGNVIVSGYGFTGEKDYLYQINKQTGKTVDRIVLKDAPDYIDLQKNGFLVYGYSHLTSFLIK